jgi:predicted CXXCH cytochrome family protein
MTARWRALPWAVALVFIVTLTLSSAARQATMVGAAASPWWLEPGDPRTYVGSRACAACHDDEHDDWHRSLHVQMTRPIGEAQVRGDFASGAEVEANGRRYRMSTREGRRFIAVSHGGRPFEEFEAQYTLGALRVQGYLSTLPDGRIYVLPVFWHVGESRWIDWKEITPVPDSDHDLRQIWNVNCFNCHATNLERRFDVAARRFETTWSEMGVTCEACHGPGRAHSDLMERWEALREQGVATVPSTEPRAPNAVGREPGSGSRDPGARSRRLKIFAAKSADRRQVFDLCAYCHGNKNNVFTGFLPGDRYEDYALPFLVSQPPPADDPQGDYWPDGRPSRFNRPQALTLSGCFLKGAATCTSCHVAHGSSNAHSLKVPIARSDELCTQCHSDKRRDTNAILSGPGAGSRESAPDPHTHHAADSEGSRCINCHMSNVNWRLLIRRRDHTFQPPTPEITARYGAPNACTECHENRPPEWAAGWLDRWYGAADATRRTRALAVADAFYGAADRNPQAPSRLASLVADRTHGALVRASAADALGRLLSQGSAAAARTESQTSFADEAAAAASPAGAASPAAIAPPASRAAPVATARPALVNALIGGAADPEPMVRATATHALGLAAEPRATMPLVARLTDPARLVRVNAAEALLALGIVQLPGAAGTALAQAQDEYAASLRTFPDRVGDHVSLGWLEMQRGAESRALEALGRAASLDPGDARTRVLLGIIDARNGRYGAALERWRAVKRSDPAYPNIDRFIDEAERRSAKP